MPFAAPCRVVDGEVCGSLAAGEEQLLFLLGHLPHFLVDLLPLFFVERLCRRAVLATASGEGQDEDNQSQRPGNGTTHRCLPFFRARELGRGGTQQAGGPASPSPPILERSLLTSQ